MYLNRNRDFPRILAKRPLPWTIYWRNSMTGRETSRRARCDLGRSPKSPSLSGAGSGHRASAGPQSCRIRPYWSTWGVARVCSGRRETVRNAEIYLTGLCSDLPHKNGETMEASIPGADQADSAPCSRPRGVGGILTAEGQPPTAKRVLHDHSRGWLPSVDGATTMPQSARSDGPMKSESPSAAWAAARDRPASRLRAGVLDQLCGSPADGPAGRRLRLRRVWPQPRGRGALPGSDRPVHQPRLEHGPPRLPLRVRTPHRPPLGMEAAPVAATPGQTARGPGPPPAGQTLAAARRRHPLARVGARGASQAHPEPAAPPREGGRHGDGAAEWRPRPRPQAGTDPPVPAGRHPGRMRSRTPRGEGRASSKEASALPRCPDRSQTFPRGARPSVQGHGEDVNRAGTGGRGQGHTLQHLPGPQRDVQGEHHGGGVVGRTGARVPVGRAHRDLVAVRGLAGAGVQGPVAHPQREGLLRAVGILEGAAGGDRPVGGHSQEGQRGRARLGAHGDRLSVADHVIGQARRHVRPGEADAAHRHAGPRGHAGLRQGLRREAEAVAVGVGAHGRAVIADRRVVERRHEATGCRHHRLGRLRPTLLARLEVDGDRVDA